MMMTASELATNRANYPGVGWTGSGASQLAFVTIHPFILPSSPNHSFFPHFILSLCSSSLIVSIVAIVNQLQSAYNPVVAWPSHPQASYFNVVATQRVGHIRPSPSFPPSPNHTIV